MWPYILFSLFVYGFANFYRKKARGGLDPAVAGLLEAVPQVALGWLVVLFFQGDLAGAFSFDSVAAGFCLFVGVTLLYAALKEGGYASSVATVMNLNALVTVPLALLFLGESLSLQGVAGVALAILVVPLLGSLKLKAGNWLKLAVAAMVFLGVMNYFNASAVKASSAFLAFASYMTVGLLFYAAYSLVKKGKELRALSFGTAKRALFAGLCFGVATLSMFSAYAAGGAASIVVPVVNMNLVITAFLSSAFYKERLGWKGWAAVALAVASVWLLAG